jgi:glucokinase
VSVPPAPLAIGIDIGGTKVAGGVVDSGGQVLASSYGDTPAHDVARTRHVITEVIRELASAYPVAAVGIGAAGWIDADGATVRYAPNLAWRDEPLRESVSAAVGLPVVVENDGNAAAWAEFRFGAGRAASDSMVLVSVGTGIGGGIVVAGGLVRGGHGMAAEMGHIRAVPDGLACGCGRRGCLEQYASGRALVRLARTAAAESPGDAAGLLELAGGEPAGITGPMVTAAARAGDKVSTEAFQQVGRWLGSGLADLVQLLDPQVIVIAGGVAGAGELLLVPAREAFTAELAERGRLPVAPVHASELGGAAGVVGAADLARRR